MSGAFAVPRPKALEIIKAVERSYSLAPGALKTRTQRAAISQPRQLAMYLIRDLCPRASYEWIGRQFGGLHHTSVIAAHVKIGRLVSIDADTRALVKQFRSEFAREIPPVTTERPRAPEIPCPDLSGEWAI